jgi:hypothetical protein
LFLFAAVFLRKSSALTLQIPAIYNTLTLIPPMERKWKAMKKSVRLSALLMALLLCLTASAQAAGKSSATPTPAPLEIQTEVIEEIPETIQKLLDLAYNEWIATAGKNLKTKNKYTKWRNNYEFEWCGGFVTWCMLQLEIPQQEWAKTPKEEVPGIVHVKEAGVGKLVTGYTRMNRLTMIPQKGFIAVFGNGKKFKGTVGATPYYHVGLVYDVKELSPGKYRITTIEGNVDASRTKEYKHAAHTVRMYTRDYHPGTEKKKDDLTLVPETERTRDESITFSYDYTYNNPSMYISYFLMPWVPGDPELELVPAEVPAP